MTAVTAQNLEKNAVVLRRKSASYNDRRATDKYWGILFIVVLIVWIAVYQREEKFDPYKRMKEYSKSFENITNYTMPSCSSGHCIDVYRKFTFPDEFWGYNWMIDTIASNVAFLEEHYVRSGSIVIWANVLVCSCLIAYAMVSLSTNKMYRAKFPIFGIYFICTLSFRYSCLDSILHFSDFSMSYWFIAELILLLLTVLYMTVSQCFNEDHDEIIKDKKINVWSEIYYFIGFVFTILIPLILFIGVLVVFSILVYLPTPFTNFLFSFFGLICYIFLVTYYFLNMVACCAFGLSHDRETTRIQDFLRAWIIVSRYHFGTACYHATIIVPKIKAMLIMNEEEFKVIPLFSTIERLYMMHWKVHDLSLMMTAVRGYDYSEAVRESLRLSTRDSPKPIKNSCPSYSQLFRCGSTLLIAINNLVIIGLWACGVMPDPNFILTNYFIYLMGMFLTCILGKLHDVSEDTEWLYSDKNVDIDVLQTI